MTSVHVLLELRDVLVLRHGSTPTEAWSVRPRTCAVDLSEAFHLRQEIKERHHDEDRCNERTSGYPIKQRQYDGDEEENSRGNLQQVRFQPCERIRHDLPSPIFNPPRASPLALPGSSF